MHRAKKHLCGCCLKYNIYAANVDGRDGIVNLAHCCNRFQLFLFTLGLADGLQICSLLSWPQKVSGFCVLASACPLQFRCILAFHTVHSDSVLGGSRRCSCCSSRGHLHNPHLADEAFDCTPWRDQLLQLEVELHSDIAMIIRNVQSQIQKNAKCFPTQHLFWHQ